MSLFGWKTLPRRLRAQASIPLLLLLLAQATGFALQAERTGFLTGHHGYLSSHGMALAANLSPAHHFLLFNAMSRNEDGSAHYDAYNRFPLGAFAAIKLITLPAGGRLGAQLLLARLLMVCFFAAAGCLAYRSAVRLTGNRWTALATSLLAFSSYYCLHYSDMVFNDVPALFGMMLVFHGMVVFLQEGRFRQLAVKSCVALFLGWQALALLLPFTALGYVRELRATRSLRSAAHSRFFLLGVVSVALGGVLLGGILLGEHLALRTPLGELPTYRMMLWRLGLGDAESYDPFAQSLSWPAFLQNQAYRLGRMSVPDILVHYKDAPGLFTIVGTLIFVAAVVAALLSRRKLLLGSLILSMPCWALPMRHFVAFHDFQCMFYVGVTLTFFGLLARLAARMSRSASIGLGIAAFLLFSLSSLHLAVIKVSGTGTEERERVADFQRIIDRVGRGHTVFVDGDYHTLGGAQHAVGFYLAGNYIQTLEQGAEFVLSGRRDPRRPLLTPENTRVFLSQGPGR